MFRLCNLQSSESEDKGIMKLKREAENLTYFCNTMKSAMEMLNKEKKADKQSINDFENQSNRFTTVSLP